MSNNRRMSLDDEEQESSEPEDIDSPTESQSPASPMRRSSRVRQRQQRQQSTVDSDADSAEEDSPSNRNHNHNQNRRVDSDDDSGDDDDEEKNIAEPPAAIHSANDEDENGDEEEDSKDGLDEFAANPFADFSVTLPTHISTLNGEYTKLNDDIHEVNLQHLIDAAASLAEYNHECKDYEQQTQRLDAVMHRLLNVSRDLKVEQLMLGRIGEGIRDEKLSEVSGIDLSDDASNPLKLGCSWNAFFDEYRSQVVQEIEEGQAKDSEAVQLKQFVRSKTGEYEQLFQDATRVDPIEEADDNSRNHNHNHATPGGEEEEEDDDDDDEDIVIAASSNNVNVGSIKCPLTQQIFKHPFKSQQCGHTFEREAIQRYMREKQDNQELTECPLPGCNTILLDDQFIRDVRVEKLIKKQRKTEQDQDSGEEDDDAFDLTVRPSL